MGRKSNDLVWSCFTRQGKGVICNYCKKHYVVANVTKMATHLSSSCLQCPNKIRKAIRENKTDSTLTKGTIEDEHEEEMSMSMSSDCSTNTLNTSGSSSSGLRSYFDRISDDTNTALQEKMAKAIFVTGMPLGIFEHSLWIEFFNSLRPSFKLPTRKVVSTKLLEKQYAKMESEVKDKLSDAENLHLQCDGWSNCRNESIINFIISCPTPLFVKFLETKDESHNADYLCGIMDDVLQQYGVDKFFVAIGDNAANMQAALKLLKNKYPHIETLGCIAHLMHLLCGDIIKCASAKAIINTANHIIKRIKKAHKLSALFSKLQKEKGINCALKLPGKTRWGSALFSLQSLAKNRNVIQILAVADAAKDKFKPAMKKSILSDDFWNKVNTLIKVLTPVIAANIQLEGDEVLIHKVHKTMADLEKKFAVALSSDNTFKAKDKQAILSNLKSRKEQANKPIHLAASVLFPANRGCDLDASESIEAMEFIYETARNMSLDTKTLLTEIADYKAKTGIWKKDFVWMAIEEMCPLQWWKTFYSQTVLSKVAVRILSVPISSSATERSNSTFGWIHSNKRNRLSTQRAGKITYLAHNWKLLNPLKKRLKKANTQNVDQPHTSTEGSQCESSTEDEIESESELSYSSDSSDESSE